MLQAPNDVSKVLNYDRNDAKVGLFQSPLSPAVILSLSLG
jgi:hypothetical protein